MSNILKKYIDKMEKQRLYEKHYSGPLYHATDFKSALSILQEGEFRLRGPVWFDVQPGQKYNETEYFWMSVSRDKLNLFREHYKSDVIFVLSGDALTRSHETIIKPMDYFSNEINLSLHLQTFGYKNFKRSEAEERLYSRKPILDITKYVSEIHIAKSRFGDNIDSKDESEIFYKIRDLAIKRNIKVNMHKRHSDDFKFLKSKVKEKVLNEKHYSGPLYHSTTMIRFAEILKSNQFNLSKTIDYKSSDQAEDKIKTHWFGRETEKYKDYNWYLSLSRDKKNSYKVSEDLDITLVIDPSVYMNKRNHTILPIDYSNFYFDVSTPKRSEAEERLWSKKKSIPLDGIKEVHVLVVTIPNYMSYYRLFEKEAQKRGFPIYFYHSRRNETLQSYMESNDYHILNKKKAFRTLDELIEKDG